MTSSEILELRIKQIKKETPSASTFVLENISHDSIPYQAGQFLTLIFYPDKKEMRRSYSICTTPEIDQDISITIKRKPNGAVSRHLLDHFKEGDILQSLPPSGRFILNTDANNKRDIFLFAAGSGITPIFSLLKKILKEEPQSNIILLYSNSGYKEIIFQKHIELLCRRHTASFTCIHFLSQPATHFPAAIQGHLNNQLVKEIVNEQMHYSREGALFLLCGPPAYMRMIMLTLRFMEFTDDQIRKENFVVPGAPVISHLPPQVNAKHIIQLNYQEQLHNIIVNPYQTILDAALQNDIQLPYSCKNGVCGTCAAHCESGKIFMRINEVLTDKEIDDGLVLTCVGYPLTENVTINLKISQ